VIVCYSTQSPYSYRCEEVDDEPEEFLLYNPRTGQWEKVVQ